MYKIINAALTTVKIKDRCENENKLSNSCCFSVVILLYHTNIQVNYVSNTKHCFHFVKLACLHNYVITTRHLKYLLVRSNMADKEKHFHVFLS